MSSIPALSEPLAGEMVVVRDYQEHDIPEVLIAYQDDPLLHLRMGEERPPSGAELGRLAERQPQLRATGTGATLTIAEQDSGTTMWRGQINVHQVDWQHQRAELGILVAPRARGRGLGRVALRLVGEWLLRRCGLERVQILTEPSNKPMLRAARGAGFTFEGILRGYLRDRGSREDTAILSLLPTDL